MNWDLLLLAIAAVLSGLGVAWLTCPVRRWLLRLGVYDTPNARSSHSELKPRGGGLGLFLVLLPVCLAAAWITGALATMAPLVALTAALAAVSFADDVQGLTPAVRLSAQAVAVALGVWWLDLGPVAQGLLPAWLDTALTVLAWLWFINLYNFMDGIDGISGVETIAIGLGIGLVAVLDGTGAAGAATGWLVAGATAGFLFWNWAPARLFMGDVGSVPLGFLLGWLLLDLAARGHWAPALILPAYYLFDATLTLLRRMVRFEKVWRAHREHAYQKAVQAGMSHAAVAGRIALLNAVLVALALAAGAGYAVPAAFAAIIAVFLVWANLLRRRPARA